MPPHKCKLITDPTEFSITNAINDSLVEQLHAVQRSLGMTMQSSSSERAMFLVQCINYDIYCELADRAKIPIDKRTWPADADVYRDDDDVTSNSSSLDETLPSQAKEHMNSHHREFVSSALGSESSDDSSDDVLDEDDDNDDGEDDDDDDDEDGSD